MRVDFFIAGVQKGGTTVLDHMLRGSPHVAMARRKEVHFFDDETIDWRQPDYARLHAQFDPESSAALRGEATPAYTFWPGALERIARYNPDAKLVMMLRHPSFRAFSHWRMTMARKREPLSFAEAIAAGGRARVRSGERTALRIFSYIERSLYAGQIETLLRLFPRDQVLFLRTDALWNAPQPTLDRVQDFLGVDRCLVAEQRYIAPVQAATDVELAADQRKALDRFFADDIRRTAELTELDLVDWLSPDYAEPMQAPPRQGRGRWQRSAT